MPEDFHSGITGTKPHALYAQNAFSLGYFHGKNNLIWIECRFLRKCPCLYDMETAAVICNLYTLVKHVLYIAYVSSPLTLEAWFPSRWVKAWHAGYDPSVGTKSRFCISCLQHPPFRRGSQDSSLCTTKPIGACLGIQDGWCHWSLSQGREPVTPLVTTEMLQMIWSWVQWLEGRSVCFFPFSFSLSFKGVRYGKRLGWQLWNQTRQASIGDKGWEKTLSTFSNMTSVTMNLKVLMRVSLGSWWLPFSERRGTGREWQGVTLLEGHCLRCFGVLPSTPFSYFK